MHYLGIDWASDKHDLCLMTDDGTVLSEFTINQSQTGFKQLKALLDEFDDVAINIERSDGLLVDWLVQQGCTVYVTQPEFVARRRTTESKSDPADARLLAHLLRESHPECRPIVQQSDTVLRLRHLINNYDHLVSSQRRLGNRLGDALGDYYPALLQAFSRCYSLISLAFLEAFPRPQDARALSIDELDDFLRQQRYNLRKKRLPTLYRVFQTPMPTVRCDAGYIDRALLLVPRLRLVYRQWADTKKQIVAVFNTHPEAAWWKQFPGTSGPLTPARLLAAIGDDRSRFPSRGVFQAMAGVVPVTRTSGKSRQIRFRNACSKDLRKAFDHFARQSVKKSGWARSYYNHQRARGHSETRAYRALGTCWTRIIWKLWHTGEAYNEATHVANRSEARRRMSA